MQKIKLQHQFVSDPEIHSLHNHVIEEITRKSEEFWFKLLTMLFGREPDLEKDKDRLQFHIYPDRKTVILDGIEVGKIIESQSEIKTEYNPEFSAHSEFKLEFIPRSKA